MTPQYSKTLIRIWLVTAASLMPLCLVTGAESESKPAGKIGFFDDGPPSDSVDRIPADPAFDHYFSPGALVDAWEESDPEAMATAAAQMMRGRSILYRSRYGISADAVWSAAASLASATGNKAALKTLADAADQFGNSEAAGEIRASMKLAGQSRHVPPSWSVDVHQTSIEEFELLHALRRSIQTASLRGDKQFLDDLGQNLDDLPELSPENRKRLRGLIHSPQQGPPGIDAATRRQLDKLRGVSRGGLFGGGGGFSVPTPNIPAPKLPSIPKPNIPRPNIPKPNIPRPNIPNIPKPNIPNISIHDIRREGQNVIDAITPPADELWGEAGRYAYAAAAGVMSTRNANRQVTMIGRHDRAVLRPHFGNTVDRVQLFWGADPLNQWCSGGMCVHLGGVEAGAQTYGHDVYIRAGSRDMTDQQRLETLIHELVHVKQYERYGSSLSNFGYHYFKNYKRANLSYENNKLEREAYETEARLFPQVWRDFQRRVSGGGPGSARPPSLIGHWRTNGRAVTFDPNGMCTIRTPQGMAQFQFQYDPGSGTLYGLDPSGQQTRTLIVWHNPNSFEWRSPTGVRHYVRDTGGYR